MLHTNEENTSKMVLLCEAKLHHCLKAQCSLEAPRNA